MKRDSGDDVREKELRIDTLICIYSGKNLVDLELIQSTLENARIPCMVRTNDASGTMPHLGLERGTEIFIPKARKEKAIALLEPFRNVFR